MKTQNLIPAHIACSSAKRTQETCGALLKGLETPVHAEFSKMLYSASFGDLLAFIQSTDDSLESLMIIGHNPTIYEVAVRLASEGPDTILNHLAQGYAPATLSLIEANIEHWAEINPSACKITTLLDPLDYNAPATPARWT